MFQLGNTPHSDTVAATGDSLNMFSRVQGAVITCLIYGIHGSIWSKIGYRLVMTHIAVEISIVEGISSTTAYCPSILPDCTHNWIVILWTTIHLPSIDIHSPGLKLWPIAIGPIPFHKRSRCTLENLHCSFLVMWVRLAGMGQPVRVSGCHKALKAMSIFQMKSVGFHGFSHVNIVNYMYIYIYVIVNTYTIAYLHKIKIYIYLNMYIYIYIFINISHIYIYISIYNIYIH